MPTPRPGRSRWARRPLGGAAVAVLVAVAAVAGAGCADGGISLGFATGGFCEQLRDLRDLTSDLGTLDESTALANGVEALEQLADAAPPDIRDAVDTLYEQARLVADTFLALEPDDLSSLDDLADLLSQTDLSAVQQASARIAEYVVANCDGGGPGPDEDEDGGD